MTTQKETDLSLLTHPQVKKAIEAQQHKDLAGWYACFAKEVSFLNDGKQTDFHAFFDKAFDYNEHFLSIEKVAENGLYLFGNYFGGLYGTYRAYFRFQEDNAGLFNGLEMAQVGLTLNESWHQPAF